MVTRFKNFVGLFLFVLLTVSNAQEVEPKHTPLDPLKYDAWTIEYPPYKWIVEEKIKAYRVINPDENQNIPVVGTGDKVALVVSKFQKDNIVEIWYGADGHYTILKEKQVDWILGESAEEELRKKNTYFNLDARFIFEDRTGSAAGLNYIHQKNSAALSDVQISPDLIDINLSISRDYSFIYKWGYPRMALVNNQWGGMVLGVRNQSFEIGVRMPPVFYLNTDLLSLSDGIEAKHLNGGWGSFGAIKYQSFTGEISFVSPPSSSKKDFDASINDDQFLSIMDLSLLMYTDVQITHRNNQESLISAIFQGGLYLYRVQNYKYDPSGIFIPRTNTLDGDTLSSHQETKLGLYLSLDACTKVNQKIGRPLIEAQLQLHTSYAFMTALTVNINRHIAVPIYYTYMFEELQWAPRKALHIGFRTTFDL